MLTIIKFVQLPRAPFAFLLITVLLSATAQAQFLANNTNSGWAVRSGALILDAGGSLPDRPLLTRGNLFPVLSSGAIDAGVGAGWEVELEKQISKQWSIGTRYSRIDSWEERFSRSGLVNGAGVRFSNSVLGVLGAVTGAYDLSYGVDFGSLDVMAKRRLAEWCKVSIGVRHLRLDDHFSARITGGGFTTLVGLEADNELTGGQIGTEILLLEYNRFSVLANGLTGVYYNDVNTRVSTRTNIPRSSQFRADTTALVSELELKTRYSLSQRISIEGGYRLLFLDNIALATEQANINPVPPGAMIAADTQDSRILQGATANLVLQF